MNTNKNVDVKILLIKKGPSRDKLLDAFKYNFDKVVALPISFCVEADEASGYSFTTVELSEIKIISISHVGEDGHLLGLKGYCCWRVNEMSLYKYCNYEAIYNTQTRQGTITLYTPKD